VLTSAGDPLYVTAEEIEAQLLRAQGDLSETDMELSRSVRIGAANAFTTLLLCSRLGKLKTVVMMLGPKAIAVHISNRFS